jgi:hypothetical protein
MFSALSTLLGQVVNAQGYSDVCLYMCMYVYMYVCMYVLK